MTAVIDQPTEPLVTKGPEGIVFLARRRELVLVIEGIEEIYGPNGRSVGQTKGKKIKFVDGKYLTADPIELQTLRSHRLLGDVSEGFWEVEPSAPAVTREELDNLMALTLDFSLPGLQSMLEQEQAGWNRPALVEPLKTALARIQELYDAEEAKKD